MRCKWSDPCVFIFSAHSEKNRPFLGFRQTYSDVLLSWPPSSSQIPWAETCRETSSLWLNRIPPNSSVFFSRSKFNLRLRSTFRRRWHRLLQRVYLSKNRRHGLCLCGLVGEKYVFQVSLNLRLWLLCSVNRRLWRESVSLQGAVIKLPLCLQEICSDGHKTQREIDAMSLWGKKSKLSFFTNWPGKVCPIQQSYCSRERKEKKKERREALLAGNSR